MTAAEGQRQPPPKYLGQERKWRPTDPDPSWDLSRPPAQGEKAGWSSSELLAGRRLGREYRPEEK